MHSLQNDFIPAPAIKKKKKKRKMLRRYQLIPAKALSMMVVTRYLLSWRNRSPTTYRAPRFKRSRKKCTGALHARSRPVFFWNGKKS